VEDHNAQEFSLLVTQLSELLRNYVVNSEDADANPLEHFALIHTLASLEFLQSFAHKEPNAVALMEELFYRQKDLLDELQKH
tara:strand:+ start:564 stop:809 length:246 start_codon:yes stop_codon:yes gene_type:complete